jgi:hypothetical protein
MFPFFGFPRRAANLGISLTGAIVLPAFSVSGQAQIGRNMVGSVNLPAITVSGSASVAAQPTITITDPANADAYTFEGTDFNTQSRTVGGTSAAGSGGSVSSVAYSVTGATSQSGTATGTTSWSFSITSLAFGASTVTVTVNHSNGSTKTDAITINRTPHIETKVTHFDSWAKTHGVAGYVRGHSTNSITYSVVRDSDGATVQSGSCTTGTGYLSHPWGGGYTAPTGCLGWTTPVISASSYTAGVWYRVRISSTNAAGTTTKQVNSVKF